MAEKLKNQAYGSFSFAATFNTSILAKAELGETSTTGKEGIELTLFGSLMDS